MKFFNLKARLVDVGFVVAGVALVSAPLFAQATFLDRQLDLTMTGSDVSALQTFLATDESIYPQGLVTGYYGFLTKAAVSNFQSQNGLPSVGRVGPLTLVVLNAQMGSGSTAGPDRSAPTITNVNTKTSSNGATIVWVTSDAARGKFYYSTSPIQIRNTFDSTGVDFVEPSVSGNVAAYDGVARMSQVVSLTGLSPNTTYYYLVVAFDWSNNVSITQPASFHTSN